ncbi:MAG: hypothetical protein V2I63_01490 [Pseudomonadales bacterium]|jgi:hypothetical protein|nr:hypothetical protein [Pseudomonadales bacterium]
MVRAPFSRALCALVTVVVMLQPTPGAARSDETGRPPPDALPVHLLSLTGEANEEGGGLVGVTLDLDLGAGWRVDGTAAYASALDEGGVDSTRLAFGASHEGERLGMRVGAFGWRDPDVVDAIGGEGAVTLYRGDFWLEVSAEMQRNDFATIAVDREIQLRDQTLSVRARADCDIDGAGIGLRIGVSGERWSLRAGGTDYAWEDAACDFDAPGLERLARSGRAVFSQLAVDLTRTLSATATSWVNRQSVLFDYSADLGVSRTQGLWRLELDYLFARELFLGEDLEVWRLGLGRGLGLQTSLDGYAGRSAGERDEVIFAGLSLTHLF